VNSYESLISILKSLTTFKHDAMIVPVQGRLAQLVRALR
jgi:hypothetical protein